MVKTTFMVAKCDHSGTGYATHYYPSRVIILCNCGANWKCPLCGKESIVDRCQCTHQDSIYYDKTSQK